MMAKDLIEFMFGNNNKQIGFTKIGIYYYQGKN